MKEQKVIDEEETLCNWIGASTFVGGSIKLLKIDRILNCHIRIIHAFGVHKNQKLLTELFLYDIITKHVKQLT